MALVFVASAQTAQATSGGTSVSPGATPAPANHNTGKAQSQSPGVSISSAHCVPFNNCGTNAHEVSTHGRLQLSGHGLQNGMTVSFPRTPGARIARNSPIAHLHKSSLGLVVAVPSSAHSGSIEVMLSGGRHSNSYGPIHVTRHQLHPPVKPQAPPTTTTASAATGTALAGQGMWIWYVNQSNGGSVSSILAQAKAANLTTLFIKSSDGSSNYWSQFSTQLIAELHAGGMKVCAWQYVYGTNPVGEAELGARAVAAGADCLVIDAEAEYEGKYGAAQTYIQTLRSKIGESYPVALASFPYVDYHESFPYSVFLGPGGAQFNAPQMYWKDIGTSVENVFVHTYEENLIYGRTIEPLGQTYAHPSASEIVAFRSLAGAYGAAGLSFWDWQETPSSGWKALVEPLNTSLTVPQPELTSPLLKQGAKGDQVLWLQEHLASAISTQQTTGTFDSTTKTDLEQFQSAHGIAPSGETDPTTWAALLALPPVAVDWTGGGPQG
jgi:peptidoglycan hydrolase-like protein with peptidoglycan-binding domain